jgi:hypothetical protein
MLLAMFGSLGISLAWELVARAIDLSDDFKIN